MRVGFVLRSAEIKPLFHRFVTLYIILLYYIIDSQHLLGFLLVASLTRTVRFCSTLWSSAISWDQYRIPFELRSQAPASAASTMVGDPIGSPRAELIIFFPLRDGNYWSSFSGKEGDWFTCLFIVIVVGFVLLVSWLVVGRKSKRLIDTDGLDL